jgi:hypothetical protein
MGTKCGVLGMHRHPLSPPTYGGQTEGAEAQNRWLIADFLLVVALWVYQNFKKAFTPPNLLHPTLGLTEVRVWFERRRPILSPSMAS